MAKYDIITVDIFDIEWDYELEECDWYCDGCGKSLNNQDGFDPYCGYWECKECGHNNRISKEDITSNLLKSVSGVDMYLVTSVSDLKTKIKDYLEGEYGRGVVSFDYSANTDGLYENDMNDDDYELADFFRGGDLLDD